MFECATCGLEYYGDEMCEVCGDCESCCECSVRPAVSTEQLYRRMRARSTFDRDELGADPEED